MKTVEQLRPEKPFPAGEGWKKWGPYLSERQWEVTLHDGALGWSTGLIAHDPDGHASLVGR